MRFDSDAAGTGWYSSVRLEGFYNGQSAALELRHTTATSFLLNISQAIKIITLTLYHSYVEVIKSIHSQNQLELFDFNRLKSFIELCSHMITNIVFELCENGIWKTSFHRNSFQEDKLYLLLRCFNLISYDV